VVGQSFNQLRNHAMDSERSMDERCFISGPTRAFH
jgi:hypothetical protein